MFILKLYLSEDKLAYNCHNRQKTWNTEKSFVPDEGKNANIPMT